jgi:hypothetical protein
MRQTWALLVDMYRELNARKLFWITLILSGVFILAFALIGVDANGFKFLWFHWDMPLAQFLYKQIFSYVVVGFWLTWVATILALISTSGLFPDFLSSGSVELYFAKPIGRPRLFLTKYAGGLLFVLAQVLVFSIGSFIVFRLRGGEWLPSLFLAVPLVVCFYSYLFAICTLVGILTRSTLAALLVTLLCWATFFSIHFTESKFLEQVYFKKNYAQHYEEQARADERSVQRARSNDAVGSATQPWVIRTEQNGAEAASKAADMRSDERSWSKVHRYIYWAYAIFPKTTETTDLLDRWLFKTAEIQEAAEQNQQQMGYFFNDPEFRQRQLAQSRAQEQVRLELRRRNVAWVLGTSLAFEAVILLLAGWIFCRRDY